MPIRAPEIMYLILTRVMPSPRANIFADIFAYCWKCKKLKYRLKFTPNVERLIATWAFEFQLTIFKKEMYITIRSFESLQISFRKFDCLGKGRGERVILRKVRERITKHPVHLPTKISSNEKWQATKIGQIYKTTLLPPRGIVSHEVDSSRINFEAGSEWLRLRFPK